MAQIVSDCWNGQKGERKRKKKIHTLYVQDKISVIKQKSIAQWIDCIEFK